MHGVHNETCMRAYKDFVKEGVGAIPQDPCVLFASFPLIASLPIAMRNIIVIPDFSQPQFKQAERNL